MLECLGIGEGAQGAARREKRLERQVLYRQLLLEEVIRRTNATLQQALSAIDAQIAAASDAWKAHDLRGLKAQLRRLSGAHHLLYGPGDGLASSLKSRLAEICSSIFEAHGRRRALVALSVKVEDIELQQHQEICVCLMAQELVSHVLTHAFPQGRSGIVSIELHLDRASVCHLTVTDNGARRYPTYPGSGLAIVKGLASVLEGHIELDFRHGMTARVSFPVDAD
jgi:two-component sensor histidine kinase